jgi:antitoxin HigA-1
MKKTEKLMPPVHPGEVLREDFMKPLGLSVNRLALELHVPATRIGEIVHERRRITAETALRLARYFCTNAEFWLNLQNFYDLELSARSGKASEIEQQVRPALYEGRQASPARESSRRLAAIGGGEPGVRVTARRRSR